MRIIEFKGKRVDTGEWVYGGLIYVDGRTYIFEDGSLRRYEVKPVTVGQYTNVDDVGNNRIYEGDIVSYYDTISNGRRSGVVEFYNGRYIILTEYRTQIDLCCALDKKIGTLL